jgi:hypothetical protein
MECLIDEFRKDGMTENVMSCLGNFIDGHCIETTAEDDVHLVECFDIIEQALMKSQEPKKYLKWEDLETETGSLRVDLEVSLNGTEYRLSYFQNDTLKLLTNDEDFYLEIEDKQFFDSLHLERIEENE